MILIAAHFAKGNMLLKFYAMPQNTYASRHLATPLFKNAYFIMAGSALTSIFGFLSLLVATRLFSVEAVGLTTAAISALGIIAIFSELGLGIGLIRFLPWSGKNGNNMLNSCLTLCGLTSIVLSIIFLSGIRIWSPALLLIRQDISFFLAFVLFALVAALQPLVLNTYLARRNAKFIFISSLITSSLRLVLVIIFAIFLNNTFGLFVSAGLAVAISLMISLKWLLPKVQCDYSPRITIKSDALRDMWHYSMGNYISRSVLLLTPLILPLMVVNILSAEMNAYFYVAWAITSILLVIPSSISNSLFAEGSNEEASLKTNTVKSLKLMLTLLIPLTIIIFILADNILMVFGQSYADNSPLFLRILVLSVIPYAVNYLYISISRVTRNLTNIIKITAILTGLSLGLSYFLMLKIGLVGVVIGYLAGQSIVATAVAIILLRDLAKP